MNVIKIAVNVAAKGAVQGFDAAGRAAANAGAKFEGASDKTDDLASKSGTLTGALGAVGGGLGLIGMEKYAASLATAATASDLVSGASDLITLALQSSTLAKVKDVAAMAAHKAASIAGTVATGAMAAAQWALNAALSANPIGLAVAALVALVAILGSVTFGLVLAYKKSDRFREIVDKAAATAKRGLQAVGKIVLSVATWIGTNVPTALAKMRDTAVRVFEAVTTPQRTLIRLVTTLAGWFKEKVPAALTTLRDKVREIAAALLAPFRELKSLIDRILGLIDKIDLPNIDLPGLRMGRTTGTAGGGDGFDLPPEPPAAPLQLEITLTAEHLSDLEQGRRIVAKVAAYERAGGRRRK